MSTDLESVTFLIPPLSIVNVLCDCRCSCHGQIAGGMGPCLSAIEPGADDCRAECRTSRVPCDPFRPLIPSHGPAGDPAEVTP